MSSAQPAPADRHPPRGHLLVLNRSFRRTLEAENKRPGPSRATPTPSGSSPPSAKPTPSQSLPVSFERQHIQEFIADQLARWKPATAHNRCRGLHAFFKLAVAEGDLEASLPAPRPPTRNSGHLPVRP
jgi:hypothetical protein